MSKSRDDLKWTRLSTHRKLRSLVLAVPLGLVIGGQAGAALPPGYRLVRVIDTIVNNTDPSLFANDTFGDSETSLGINPKNPDEVTILGFSGGWGSFAPLFHTSSAGTTWSKLFDIPQPPGGFTGPNDQTLDWGQNGLDFSFLGSFGSGFDVVSVRATDPTNSATFNYRLNGGNAAITNVNGTQGAADQPWLIVNRDPFNASQQNTYVGYTDLSVVPVIERVAVSNGVSPLNFTVDNQVGVADGTTEHVSGLRVTGDPATGTVYAIWGTCSGNCLGDPKQIDYMLNRSTDGGVTWSANGSTGGTVIVTANSSQPIPKFGTVNGMFGGVHHATVDPATGAVYYVYGTKSAVTGNDRLGIRRVTFDLAGTPTIGPEHIVTSAISALPQVAVDANGTVAVMFHTFDGFNAAGFPTFTAHMALSTDQGTTFTDQSLVSFRSPVTDDGQIRQRILGDYQQMKSLDSCFHGAFVANGSAFGRPIENTDAIYAKVCRQADICVFASQNLDLRDRDQITAPTAAGTFMTIGSAARVIDEPKVNGNAFMRDQSVVQGDLTLAGTLQHQNTFTITGTLRENARDVLLPALATRTFPVGTGTQVVPNNAIVSLTPGNFGAMTFRSRSQVTLTAGTYNFASLNIEPDVRVIANGTVNVNVQGQLTIGDRDRFIAGSPQSLTIYTNSTGTVLVGTDIIATGLLVAPTATITAASRLALTGCIGGRNVTIDTDARVNASGATLPVVP
jgi:hypothetical protein